MDEANSLHATPQSLPFKKVLRKAIADTWLYCPGCPDDPEEAFLARWGKVTDEQDLLRILQQGEERDRAVALFALGEDHSPHVRRILEPYLQSSFLGERWASALTLGRQGDEKALLALLTLLQEDTLEGWITCDDPDLWGDFSRRNIHRFEMVRRLGDWGNQQITPALYQLLKKYIEEEQRFAEWLNTVQLSEERENLYALEDHFAYALGQLGAWGSLRALPWLEDRQRIATVMMVLGGLQIHHEIPSIREWLSSPAFADSIFNYKELDKEQVKKVLASRFGYTLDEQDSLIQQFAEDCRRRLY
jgi:HEAT repeat protein